MTPAYSRGMPQRRKFQKTRLTYLGKTQSLHQWSKDTGINSGTLQSRLSAGWTTEALLTTPPLKRGETAAAKRERPSLYLSSLENIVLKARGG